MTDLAAALKSIGLGYTAKHLDDLVSLATKRRMSPTQLLEHLADEEHKEKARRSLERRLARSRLGRFKPMGDFDWSWPKCCRAGWMRAGGSGSLMDIAL
jgi:hypothetical protein